jgi:anti-sigma factor RsiW
VSTNLHDMDPDLKASDAERDAVAEALRTNAAAGRLTPDELEQRLEQAYAARTRAELEPLLADLPPTDREAPPRPRPEPRRLPAFSPVIAISVLLVAIWALTGAGYFWPVWPIGALVLSAFKHRGLSAFGHHRWPQGTCR